MDVDVVAVVVQSQFNKLCLLLPEVFLTRSRLLMSLIMFGIQLPDMIKGF